MYCSEDETHREKEVKLGMSEENLTLKIIHTAQYSEYIIHSFHHFQSIVFP